jgi:hypothetical protein
MKNHPLNGEEMPTFAVQGGGRTPIQRGVKIVNNIALAKKRRNGNAF